MNEITKLIPGLQKTSVSHATAGIIPTQEPMFNFTEYTYIQPPIPKPEFQSLPQDIQQKILRKPLKQNLRAYNKEYQEILRELDDVQNYFIAHQQSLQDFDATQAYRSSYERQDLRTIQDRTRHRQRLVKTINDLQADYDRLIDEHNNIVRLNNETLDFAQDYGLNLT